MGYDLIYRDGLNRFYLSHHKMELKSAFAFGPNVFDGFSLSGTASSSFCEVQREKLFANAEREAELGSQITTLEADQQRTVSEMERLTSQHAEREAELGSQIATLEADQQRTVSEMERLTSQHAEREAELGSQIVANLQEITRLHDVIFRQSKWGEASVRHVNELTHEISSLRNSTSWRLTRPLRGIGSVVKGGILLVRRIPGVIVRRTARVCRRRAPRLYFKLATTRSVRQLYEPFAGRGSLTPYPPPVAMPVLVTTVVSTQQFVESDANIAELGIESITLSPEQTLSLNRIEVHSSSVEFALLAALSKAPQGRRIYA
jgi:hypothetical protein